MEDKKSVLAIIFIVFFVMAYIQWVFPTPPPSPVAPVAQQSTGIAGQNTAPVVTQGNSVAAATAGVPSQASTTLRPTLDQLKQSPVTRIDTGAAIITLNHLGGRVQSIALKDYKKELHHDDLYEMVTFTEGGSLPLGLSTTSGTDDFVLYTATNLPEHSGGIYTLDEHTPLTLSLEGILPSGEKVVKTFTFNLNEYTFSLSVTLDKPLPNNQPLWVTWGESYVQSDELHHILKNRRFSYLTPENKLKTNFLIETGLNAQYPAQWISMGDYYFASAILSGGHDSLIEQKGDKTSFDTRIALPSAGGILSIYSGPRDIEFLKKAGHSLERIVDLGIFSVVAHPILWLLNIIYSFLQNYGLAIIGLTLLLKLAFLPLTQASFKSMQAMQELQPEIAALRERIEDQTVLNKEIMGLYQKRGVNPVGGCLPVLIQIPVFLGLYNALLNSINLRHEPFAFWINDLSAPENLTIFGVHFPLMIILMGLSMLLQQWMTPSSADPTQKKIMMFMPVVFMFIFITNPMPSGLVLYWLINNIISIIQQFYIKRTKHGSAFVATAYASLGIMTIGFLLTQFPVW